jgi:hypothetical protein
MLIQLQYKLRCNFLFYLLYKNIFIYYVVDMRFKKRALMKKITEERKRILVALPKEVHTDIKIRSARRNISITEWIHRAIAEAIRKEQQYE